MVKKSNSKAKTGKAKIQKRTPKALSVPISAGFSTGSRREVAIEKINNGHLVSTYKKDKCIKVFAKTEAEAKKIAGKLL